MAALLLASALAWSRLGDVSSAILQLYPDALPARPYLDLHHARLLYLLWPITWLGVVTLFLAPGLLLVLTSRATTTLDIAVVRGFLLSTVCVPAVSVMTAHMAPGSSGSTPGVLLLTAAAFAWWAAHGARLPDEPGRGRRLAWLAALTIVAAAASIPIVFWQDLNPDGGEMLNMARSLDWFVVPRTPAGELSGLGLGMVTQAYVTHVFYLLVGLTEPAPRLPVLLYVPVAFAGALAAIESGSERRFGRLNETWLALAVALVFVSLAYNSSYHPYSADLASPGGIDLLAGVCLLGLLQAHADGRWGWTIAFALVGYFARPVAQIVCGLLLVGQVLVDRRLDRRTLVPLLAGAVLCALAAAAYERGLGASLHLRIAEPSTDILGRRLRYVSFADWGRLAYVIVPAGVLPVLSLLLWPLQDRIARVWSLAALAFVASLAFVSFTAIHQYLPVVLLALLVFGRLLLEERRQFAWCAAALVATAATMWLALPASFAVDRSTRTLARSVDYQVGDYRGGRDGFAVAFAGKDALLSLFPDYRGVAPDTERIVGPLMLIHYATQRPAGTDLNFRVLPPGREAGAGWTLAGETAVAAAWVKDTGQWTLARTTPPSTAFMSPLLARPRPSLLPLWGVPQHRYDIDVKALVERLRGRAR